MTSNIRRICLRCDVIKQAIHAVVTHAQDEVLTVIAHAVADRVPEPGHAAVQAVIVDEHQCLALVLGGIVRELLELWRVRRHWATLPNIRSTI